MRVTEKMYKGVYEEKDIKDVFYKLHQDNYTEKRML